MTDPALRRMALGCWLAGFTGSEPHGWLLRALADGLGGVVLFGGNVGDGEHVRALTDRLRDAAGRDVVVALDEEGGDVTRLDAARGSVVPGAAALGWLDDPAATEKAYALLGARLATAGVTVDLAPVADVNTDPRNPVIGVRSFGCDPAHASRHVAAAVRGLQAQGVAACTKHFPGHGATISDSHHEVARVDEPEFAPFAVAVDAGTRAVMTGHLLVPSLDPGNLATTSEVVTRDLLRDRLGFTGTVVTDALEMRALAGTLGMVPGFVRALVAGADAVETGAGEYPHLTDALPAAVEAAVREGILDPKRLEDAAERTARLATPPGRHPRGGPGATIGMTSVVEGLAACCIEVLGELPRLREPLVVEARPPAGMAAGVVPWSLAEPLARLVPGTTGEHVTGPVGPFPSDRSLVVVVRDPQRHAWQWSLVDAARGHPAAVVVDVGWPMDGSEVVVPLVRTRGTAPVLLGAAAERLAGART